jgi:putative oxidoreductase
LMVHLRFGFFMNWMGRKRVEGFEYHLLAIAVAVLVLVRGAGAFSIDRLIAGRE